MEYLRKMYAIFLPAIDTDETTSTFAMGNSGSCFLKINFLTKKDVRIIALNSFRHILNQLKY